MEETPQEEVVASSEEKDHPHKKRKKDHPKIDNEEELRRRGIVYVSRMPPNMKPRHLRQLLEEWGTITRIYCAPESTGL